MRHGERPIRMSRQPILTLAALIFVVALHSGCAEEKLPADLPSETGTITISVGAI